MSLTVNDYVSMRTLVGQLAAERAKNPQMKLAFCFVGGGARGAYHAGMLEGIQQHIAELGVNLKPDLFVGTSIGAIVSYFAWLEQVYPNPSRPMGPFKNRQSVLWQQFAKGNAAAEQLLSPGALVDYATHQKPIPVISQLVTRLQAILTEWNAFAGELTAVGNTVSAFSTDIANLTGAGVQDINSRFITLRQSFDKIANDLRSIKTDAEGIDPLAVIGDVVDTATDGVKAAENFAATMDLIANDLKNLLLQTAPATIRDGAALLRALGKLFANTGALVGNVLLLTAQIEAIIAAVIVVLTGLEVFLGPVAGIGLLANRTNRLTAFILDNTKLRDQLLQFLVTTPRPLRTPPLTPASVLADVKNHVGTPLPEYHCTGANLSAKELLVFSLAQDATLQKLAAQNYWVVDLANTAHNVAPNLLQVGNVPEPLVEAVITSTSIPVAFKGHMWNLMRPGAPAGYQKILNHHVVDGGVLDNSPVDVALQAGATHIVSFELSPLLQFTSHGLGTDTKNRSMLDAYTDSFDALRDRCANQQVIDMMKANAATPAKAVPVYRIAPLAPTAAAADNNAAPATPSYDTMNFNGLYDDNFRLIQNLEDWFMQGYQDARGVLPPTLSPLTPITTVTVTDPAFKDYVTRATATAPSGAKLKLDARTDRAWAAVTIALPSTMP